MGAVARVMEDTVASIQKHIQDRIGSERYGMWFDRKAVMQVHGNTLHIDVANAFAANWIRTKFLHDARAAAQEVLEHDMDVHISVAHAASAPSPVAPPLGDAPQFLPRAAPAHSAPSHSPSQAGSALNAKYTLEEFVVGPSNQMAYQAAMQVSQHPGERYSPLFLHGQCGLGKTHLLQGICQRFMRLHPAKKWLYMTGETFTNEFLDGIKNHRTDAFRRRIRQTDLLILDDIHFLSHKKATQEEFLHTFNQIDAGGKQIVLASDCAPRHIASMTESLISRFVSGMVLRVDTPDLATRLEILRRRAARNNWQVSDAVLMHIAQSATVSVRELEGLLLQVVAGMTLMANGQGDAASVLANIKERTLGSHSPVPVSRIIEATAAHFGIATAAILGSARDKTISLARAVAMYLARQHTGMSFPEIGRAVGNKNHSTVIAACQRVESLRDAGQLVCWTIEQEVHHQAMPEVLGALENQLRRK
jgi:chromosomal replication initiator protein